MQAGKLRHKVAIYKYGESKDAVGGIVKAYTLFTYAWASVQPMLGREHFTEQRVSTEQTHRINIRYISGVESTMRIVWGTRVFEVIGAPINYMEQNKYLTFNVKETFDHDTAHPIP